MKKLLTILSLAALLTGIGSTSLPQQVKLETIRYADDTPIEVTKALEQVELNIDTTQIVTDIRLPKSSLYGSTVSWTSSNSEIITIEETINDKGAVADIIGRVHPSKISNQNVTLTATLTYIDGDKSYQGSKTFEVTVLKEREQQEVEEQELAYYDDFTSYQSNIDIGNYFKWTCSADLGQALIRDGVTSNINNGLTNGKLLEINSTRQSSNITYTTSLNANANNVSGTDKKVVAFEFSSMYEGQTNGISIALLTGNKVAGPAINIDETGYEASFATTRKLDISNKEGIWQRIRLEVNLENSRVTLYYFDYDTNQFVNLSSSVSSYDESIGGERGKSLTNKSITGLRITLNKGNSNGKVYLGDFKFDDASILKLDNNYQNPNRDIGIGLIKDYPEEIMVYEDEFDSIQIPTFTVENRFKEGTVLTVNQDYIVSDYLDSERIKINDTIELVNRTYVITLKETNEEKTVVQEIYINQNDSNPSIVDFRASYLKASETDPTKGLITISGNAYRNNVRLSYLVLEKGSPSPSKEEVLSPSNTLIGYVEAKTDLEITSGSAFSFDTSYFDISKEYDVYAVLEDETNKASEVYSSKSISTVVNISTPQDLFEMSTNDATKSSTFRVINDIDCSDYKWEFEQANTVTFSGILDGQGYTIKNFNIDTADAKVGLFSEFKGTIKNLNFESPSIAGSSDSAVIAGQMMGGTIENVNIYNPYITMSNIAESSEGYYASLVGRFRSEGNRSTIKNVNIVGASIEANKYIGLLTGGVGGSQQDVQVKMENIFASGSVNTDGAAVGLIGRNRGKTTIDNAVVFLTIANAKKEVGAFAGHNKEGGSLTVNNAVSDLKVRMMTQPTYFNNFIGSHDANTSSYSGNNVKYLYEDYSDLAESLVPTPTAISYGTQLYDYDINSKDWWEENTFLRDFNIDTNWAFSNETNLPIVSTRSQDEISISKEEFINLVNKLSEDPSTNRHAIYKANNAYNYLSSNDKQDSQVIASKTKLDQAISDFNEFIEDLNQTNSDVDDIILAGLGK